LPPQPPGPHPLNYEDRFNNENNNRYMPSEQGPMMIPPPREFSSNLSSKEMNSQNQQFLNIMMKPIGQREMMINANSHGNIP
jgi:hypothetical protein